MKLSQEQFDRISRLAALELTDAERETLQKNINTMVEYTELLQEVDTEGVEPTVHVIDLANDMREDKADYNFSKVDMVASFPDTDEAGHLRVHAVFTEDSPSN